MKKLFVTLLMVSVALCALTIMVSAAEITYTADFGTVTDVADMPLIEGISTEGRVLLRNDNGTTYTTYPTYYIMKNSKTFGTDYKNLNAKTGQNYDDSRMIMVEIPDGVTGIAEKLFGMDSTSHPTYNLEKIVILSDDYTKITAQTFRRMPTVKSVTISKSVTEIVDWGFCGSPALQEVIFEKGSRLKSIANSFNGCTSLSSINLEDCTELISLGATFDGCTSLRSISLPDSLETIGDSAFRRIGEFGFKSNYLPKSLKTIGGHFLSSCTVTNEVLYFPEGLTEISSSYNFNDWMKVKTQLSLVFLGKMTNIDLGGLLLTGVTGCGDKMPLTVVFAQNSFDELNGDFLQGVDYNGKHAYIGTPGSVTTKTSGALTLKLCNNDPNNASKLGTDENGDEIYDATGAPFIGIFCGGNTVEYCYSVRNYNTNKAWSRFFTTERTLDIDAHKTAGVHYDKKEVTQVGNCGYDEISETTCVVCQLKEVKVTALATGKHTYVDDFNCETALDCETCEKIAKEALVHSKVINAIYSEGYFVNGSCTTVCTNEGCGLDITESLMPIFVSYGYSMTEDEIGGKLSMSQFFGIDKANLGKYTTLTGNAFEYGFVVSSNADPLNEANSGLIAEGKTYITTQNGFKHDYFAVAVAGFTDATVDNALTFCVYVKDGAKVSYLDNGETVETVNMKSYNQIKALLGK